MTLNHWAKCQLIWKSRVTVQETLIGTGDLTVIDFDIGHKDGDIRIYHQDYLALNECRDEINELVEELEDSSDDSSVDPGDDWKIKIDGNQLYLSTPQCNIDLPREAIKSISEIANLESNAPSFNIVTASHTYHIQGPSKSEEVHQALKKWLGKRIDLNVENIGYLNLQTLKLQAGCYEKSPTKALIDFEILWPEDSKAMKSLKLDKLVPIIDEGPVTFQIVYGKGFTADLPEKIHSSMNLLKKMECILTKIKTHQPPHSNTSCHIYDSSGGFLSLKSNDLEGKSLSYIVEESEANLKINVSGRRQLTEDSSVPVNLVFSTGLDIDLSCSSERLIAARDLLIRYFYSEYLFVILKALQRSSPPTSPESIYLQCLADPTDFILFKYSLEALSKAINHTASKYVLPKIKLLMPYFESKKTLYHEEILGFLNDRLCSGKVVLVCLKSTSSTGGSFKATNMTFRD